MPFPGDLIGAKAAAKLLGVHLSTVYRLRDAGRLPAYSVTGTRFRFRKRDVLALVKEAEYVPKRGEAAEQRKYALSS